MIDLSRLNPVELDRFLHIQSIVERQQDAAARVRALRDYYDGEHPVLLTQRQQEYLGPLVKEGNFTFAHNLVKVIIDTLCERLNVIGFTVNGEKAAEPDAEETTPAGQAAAAMWRWFKANRMDAGQIDLYLNALRDRASYAIVDYDSEQAIPRINIHKIDDGTTGVTYHRDPTDTNRVLFANRYFYTYDPLKPGATGKERKTTYLPDQIRKYIRAVSGDWQPYTDEDGAVWPLAWLDSLSRPLGVAAVEFANPGGSEIAQVIGLQNGVNKSWLDLLAAADAAGFPLIAVEYQGEQPFGQVTDDDDLEGGDELHIGPGRALEVDNARVHRLEAANLASMLDTVWGLVAAISGVSRTPQYYLRPIGGADVPSGEALKQLESGLVKRAKARQLVFGQAWADVMRLCYRVAQTFGNENLPALPEMNIEVEWADPEVRNEATEANVAEAHKRMGVPDAEVWQRLGYTPEQIAAFERTARIAEAAKVAAVMGAMRQQQQQAQMQPANGTAGQPAQNGATQNG